MNQVKALGVAIGPGSFTSLRVGLSFIKGLAFAQALPTIGINTLDVVAASQPAYGHPLVCVLPAGRGRLAVGWFELSGKAHDTQNSSRSSSGAGRGSHHQPEVVWQAQGSPSIMTADALSVAITQESLVCGDLNADERQVLKKNSHIRLISPALSTRRPAILAELAYIRWLAGAVDDASTLAPLYLHLAEPIPDVSSEVKPA